MKTRHSDFQRPYVISNPRRKPPTPAAAGTGNKSHPNAYPKKLISALLLRHKHAPPDIILTTGSSADMALLVKARNQIRLSTTAILSTDVLYDAHKMGLIGSDEGLANLFVLRFPIAHRFKEAYRKTFARPARLYAARAYDGLLALAHAVEYTDGKTESVRSYLAKDLDMQGMSGRIRFDREGDRVDAVVKVFPLLAQHLKSRSGSKQASSMSRPGVGGGD